MRISDCGLLHTFAPNSCDNEKRRYAEMVTYHASNCADFHIFPEILVILTGKSCGWKSNSTMVEPMAQVCSSMRSVARGHILDEGKKVEAKFVRALLDV
jgi:hypothetical protein